MKTRSGETRNIRFFHMRNANTSRATKQTTLKNLTACFVTVLCTRLGKNAEASFFIIKAGSKAAKTVSSRMNGTISARLGGGYPLTLSTRYILSSRLSNCDSGKIAAPKTKLLTQWVMSAGSPLMSHKTASLKLYPNMNA